MANKKPLPRYSTTHVCFSPQTARTVTKSIHKMAALFILLYTFFGLVKVKESVRIVDLNLKQDKRNTQKHVCWNVHCALDQIGA